MKYLQVLNIGGTMVSNEGIKHLTGLKELTMGPLITDEGVLPLKELEFLDIDFRTVAEDNERGYNGPYFKLDTILSLLRLRELGAPILSDDDEYKAKKEGIRLAYQDD